MDWTYVLYDFSAFEDMIDAENYYQAEGEAMQYVQNTWKPWSPLWHNHSITMSNGLSEKLALLSLERRECTC